MAVLATNLIPSKLIEAGDTVQYISANITTIIDKCTCTNVSASPITVSINITGSAGEQLQSNIILKSKVIQPNETYLCPEIAGQIMVSGDVFITNASVGDAVVLRASGRRVS